MPTYDYRCSTCGTNFELYQSFSEDALKKCPTKKSGNSPAACTSSGRGKVEKVFSAPSISFKGSGFYKNDSRSSDPTTKSSESSNGETKSDTKKKDKKDKKESKKSDSSSKSTSKSESTSKSKSKTSSSG